jgi:hypothetical protein
MPERAHPQGRNGEEHPATKSRVALDGLASIMKQKGKLDDADRA